MVRPRVGLAGKRPSSQNRPNTSYSTTSASLKPRDMYAGEIYRRGGVAGGDASHNPTDTTYAAIPPSSTYKGPKVAGTYGGFVGVFTGVGFFVFIVLTVLVFLRYRTLRKRNDSSSAIEHGTNLGGGGRERERERNEWDREEAFEMPSTQRYERAGMESTLSFNGSDMTPPLRQGERQLYAQDGVSQEAFFDGGGGQRTYDPYTEGAGLPKYDGQGREVNRGLQDVKQ